MRLRQRSSLRLLAAAVLALSGSAFAQSPPSYVFDTESTSFGVSVSSQPARSARWSGGSAAIAGAAFDTQVTSFGVPIEPAPAYRREAAGAGGAPHVAAPAQDTQNTSFGLPSNAAPRRAQ